MSDERSTDLTTLQAALDALEHPAAVRDGGGRYLAVNEPMAELVGLPADRLCGKPDSALQPADLATHVAEMDGLVLGSGMPMDSDEQLLCRFGRRRLRAARHPLVAEDAPWAVAIVLGEPEDAAAVSQARDRLAEALGAAPVAATAPPVPDAARREREAEAERRIAEAEARAEEAERRALESQARVEELLEELRAARLDTDALLRRAAEPVAPPAGHDEPVAVRIEEADAHRVASAVGGATTLRGAARALLGTLGPAGGYAAGAVWEAGDDGVLRCAGAWTAPGEDLAGWETATWHAQLRDTGLVPDAREAAPAARPVDGDCPRAELARHAGLAAAATFGTGPVVVELLRRAPAEDEPVDGLQAAREALAEALERVAAGDAEPQDRHVARL